MDIPIPDNNPSPPPPTFTPGSGFMAAGFQPASSQSTSSATVFTPPESPKKKTSVKSIALVGVLLLVLLALILLFGKAKGFLSKAEGGCTPENLNEADVAPNSAEITFQTGKACQVELTYGTSSESLLLRIPETMAALNHRVRLAPLLPSTTYYYQVVVDGKKVGEVRSFLTKLAQAPAQAPPVVVPTTAPPVFVPTTIPAGLGGSRYTLEDFQVNFGTANLAFDVDKNGIVNIRDWLLYQKQGS